MPLFKLRKSGGPRDVEISMAGLKLGSRVLQLHGEDGGLIASLTGIVGLSGQACAVAKDENQARRFEEAAAAAGVMVDVAIGPLVALPYEDDLFDLVVIKDVLGALRQNIRVIALQQVYRVLRPGGRCLVIEPTPRGGLGALISRQLLDHQYAEFGGAETALRAERFGGVRRLADAEGMRFTEGTKPTN